MSPLDALHDGLHYLLPWRTQRLFENLTGLAERSGTPLPGTPDRDRLRRWIAAIA